MDEKLTEIYQTMLTESDMTVGNLKTGHIEGEKNAKPVKPKTTADNTVEAPEEGPSSGEAKKGGAVKNSEKAEEVETHKKEVKVGEASKFDALFKTIVSEAEMEDEGKSNEIVDAPEVEGEKFDDDLGDFESTEASDVETETDIASELRLMADRLTELADNLGIELGEDEGMGEEGLGEDEGMGEVSAGEGEENAMEGGMKESAEVTEAIKSEPEPKPAKHTTFGPKMSKTVPGKLSKAPTKHAKGSIKGTYSGTPEKAKATQFGPKMSLKAKTSGPVSKSGSDIF